MSIFAVCCIITVLLNKQRTVTVLETKWSRYYGDYAFTPDIDVNKSAYGALKDTAGRKSSRSIAVLGEMRELGSYSSKLHYEVGKTVAELGIDLLFTFGKEAAEIAKGAKENGMLGGNIFMTNDLSNVERVIEYMKLK